MHDVEKIHDLAMSLALSAGEVLQEGRREGFGDIDTKSSSVDIVTETDRSSERHIVSAIREQRPDDAIMGEEGTADRGTSGVRWVIDPLDGTVNFTYGISGFAVSIGVEIEDEYHVGVVYNPATDELFSARSGAGAFLNGRSLRVRSEQSLAHSLVATGFSYSTERRRLQSEILTRVLPAVRDIRRLGSAALDLCMVACGRVDAYYEFGVYPWDIAAGTVIAREAGAVVTAFDGRRPTGDVIAANRYLHQPLMDLVRDDVPPVQTTDDIN